MTASLVRKEESASKARKMRVLFVAGLDPAPDGAMGGQLSVARLLAESDFGQTFEVIPCSSTSRSLPPPPIWQRAKYAFIRMVRYCTLLPRADVVLIFCADGAGFAEKTLMAVLARVTGRGVVVRPSSGHLPEQCRQSLLLKVLLRMNLGAAHVVCSQGSTWTDFFAQFGDVREKVVEVRNLIRIPAETASPKGTTRILYAGTTLKEKGVFDAVEVAAMLRARGHKFEMLLAGGGRDLELLRRVVEERGLADCIHVPGWLTADQVQQELQHSSLFLFLSYAEGMPNAVLEAMATGLPVIATRCGAVPEVIEDGKCGYLVAVGDTEAASAAVMHLLEKPNEGRKVGAAGREVVMRRFDARHVWRGYAEAVVRAGRLAGKRRAIPMENAVATVAAQQQSRGA